MAVALYKQGHARCNGPARFARFHMQLPVAFHNPSGTFWRCLFLLSVILYVCLQHIMPLNSQFHGELTVRSGTWKSKKRMLCVLLFH